MKIAILSQDRTLYSTRRLKEAGQAQGHDMRVINYLRCYMNITSHRPMVYYDGKPLENIDAIIPRIGASRTFYGTAVVRQFEVMGVFSANESQAISRSRDKLRCLQILAREGIGLPVTGFAHDTEDIDGLIETVGGAPMVIKLLEGTQGIGVVLAETQQAARSVIEAFRGLNANILVQEFIKEAKGSDVRCFVVGGKVIAAMKRQGAEGEFRSNLHRGGTAEKVKLTPEERSTAVRAAKAMGLRVAGVDMLRSNHGPVVMEVNSSPGLEGIEKASEIDVAGIVIDFVAKSAASGKKSRSRSVLGKRLAEVIEIGGDRVEPGQRQRIDIPVARLPTQTMLALPVIVAHGVEMGPRLWLSAAIHGDEINGVEIIRQVLEQVNPQSLRGTLIAVPIVNIFGFIEQSRYLPDRRDLNRSFPGSPTGSLAARIAHLFMTEIVRHSTHGIDLHTAAMPRINLPQVRANLQDAQTYRFAKAFGAPIMIHATSRDGSLRQAAANQGIPVLLYEAGEALRFDGEAIGVGVRGILRVMAVLEMYRFASSLESITSLEASKCKWVRASRSGILRLGVALGEHVEKKQLLGIISDAYGETNVKVRASVNGIVIGHAQNPLVNQGDGIVHLAVTH